MIAHAQPIDRPIVATAIRAMIHDRSTARSTQTRPIVTATIITSVAYAVSEARSSITGAPPPNSICWTPA